MLYKDVEIFNLYFQNCQSETLQMELDHTNEKVEELSSELKALKDELTGKVHSETGEATSFQVKQLQAESGRLKEALVK